MTIDSPLMFGEWLRQRRNGLGLTRKEFSERVGCSVSTLRKIEDGERKPSGQIAELMASCLNFPDGERETFVRVARGELDTSRLAPISKWIDHSNISTKKTNLPVLPTPLIGRQEELNELIHLLNDPQCRLITLIGVGGIGKTRLAIETATRAQEFFSDGVYFVSLASINSSRFILPVIADALGFAFESMSRVDPKAQLLGYLKEKNILLLTDNLEHLLNEPGIEVLGELLTNASQFKLLATSREALGLQGEWLFEVHGLPVPDDIQMEGFAHDDSLELFIQRARRANVGFNPTSKELSAIQHICHLVDGTPLALELAAAWSRTLSCEEIAKEIERSFDILTANMRDLPARHRSMRAVFDHSWKLLAADEQSILLILSVFRGGFTREAAEQIAGANFSALSSLITKSLVRRSGDHRYDLHELIRQYAFEQLANQSKIYKETQKRHARYYLEFVASRGDRLRSPAQVETAGELVTEMDNFRIAWDWALNHRDLGHLRRAPATLWHFFELRNWFDEGVLVFSKAVEHIESSAAKADVEISELLNELKGYVAYFVFRQGNTVAAYEALNQVNARLQSTMNVYVKLFLGIVCRDLGKSAEAKGVLGEGLEKSKECGDLWFQSMTGQFLGIIAFEAGAFEEAHRYLVESLAIGRETGDPLLISHGLGFLSRTFQSLGRANDAEKCLQESLALTQKIGYRWGVGNALDGLGHLALDSDLQEARKRFAASCETYREIGDLRSLARGLSHWGFTSLALNDLPNARKGFSESLALARKCNYDPIILDALTGFASLYVKCNEFERALELSLVVLHHPAALQETKDRASNIHAQLESRLTRQKIKTFQTQADKANFESILEELLK